MKGVHIRYRTQLCVVASCLFIRWKLVILWEVAPTAAGMSYVSLVQLGFYGIIALLFLHPFGTIYFFLNKKKSQLIIYFKMLQIRLKICGTK